MKSGGSTSTLVEFFISFRIKVLMPVLPVVWEVLALLIGAVKVGLG